MPVLINDHMLFLHLPKCAGQFVTVALQQKLGRMRLHDNPRRSGHATLVSQGHGDRNKLVFGMVRNPWDWYVSYYHYFMTPLGPTPNEMQGFCNGVNPEPGTSIPPFKKVLERMLYGPIGKITAHGHEHLGTSGRIQVEMERHGIGFFTWCYLWHHLPNPGIVMERDDLIVTPDNHDELVGEGTNVIIPSGRCKEGLAILFDASSEPLSEQEKLQIVQMPSVNTNNSNASRGRLVVGKPSHSFYDDESTEWVRDMDRVIVDRFGYTGPGSKASRPIFPLAV